MSTNSTVSELFHGYPVWVRYGGRVWARDVGQGAGRHIRIPERVWPIVDVAWDNLGHGLIIAVGGLDMLIDDMDLQYYQEEGGE